MSSVFGFFTDKKKEEKTVKFQDFLCWFENQLKGLDGFDWSDQNEVYSQIKNSMEGLQKALVEFEEKDLPDEMAPRLKKMAQSNRKVLIKHLQSFIDKFTIPDGRGYKQLQSFLEDRSSELDKVSDNIKRSLVVLDKAQPDVTKGIVNSIRELERSLDIDEDLQKTVEIVDLYKELNQKIERLSELSDRHEKIKIELEDSLEEREKLHKKLEEIEKSEDREAIEEKRQRMGDVEKKMEKEKSRIRSSISPLKRGLKKLRYFGFFSGEEELLEHYITKPVLATKKDEGLSFLLKTTEKLDEKLADRNLDFDDSEAKRLENELDAVDINKIKSSVETIYDLEEERNKLEESIENLLSEGPKENISGKIKRKSEDIEDMRDRLEKTKQKQKDLENTIDELEDELVKHTEELLGIDVSLECVES